MNYLIIPGIKDRYRDQCAPVMPPGKIIEIVCNHYDLQFEALATKCRIKEHVHARHVIFYFLKKHTKMTLKTMGEMFNRDHTTVIHGVEKLHDIIETEPEVKADIELLQAAIIEMRSMPEMA
jgi:chromosomal replication initiator protein